MHEGRRLTESAAKAEPQREIKVVLVTASLQGGGAERVLSDMANHWAQRGWHITFATWSGPGTDDFYALHPAVQRVWLNVPSPNTSGFAKLWSNVMRIRCLRRMLRDRAPTAILSFLDWSNVLTILAATGVGAHTVVSERVHPAYYAQMSRPWKLLRRFFYRRADVVVAQTEDVSRWLEENCRANTCTIPNPLRNLPDLSVQREPFVLSVGRLYPQKGFDVLLRAFAAIRRDFCDWKVKIVGAGPELGTLVRLRDELDLAAVVSFLEPVKDVELLMSRAGLVVQPSRFEGFPNVLLESMGMGAPVISTDCPSGPSEIIEDGVNGRLVPVDDVQALSAAMAECLGRPALCARLGEKAKDVRRRFRQDVIMQQWETCLLPQSSKR